MIDFGILKLKGIDISVEKAQVAVSPIIVKYNDKMHSEFISQLKELQVTLDTKAASDVKPLTFEMIDPHKESDKDFIYGLTAKDRQLFMLVGDGVVYGYLVTNVGDFDESIHISELVVAEKYRSQGYGRLLIEHVRTVSKSKYKFIILDVNSKNPALRLYEHVGFKEFQKTMFMKL